MPNDEMLERLAAVLHTLSCVKEHPERMEALLTSRDQRCCYFYLEESLADSEQRLDHAAWEREAENLCSRLNLSPTETIRLTSLLLDLRSKLDQVLVRFPSGAKFARLVLFDEPL